MGPEGATTEIRERRWPAEDGGPRRVQVPHGGTGLGVRTGEQLRLAAVRDAFASTMVILRDPGEVFVLRHTIGRRPRIDPSQAWVERIDPCTLEPLQRSPTLAGGPFWPGGLAAHRNGSLHVVHGRHCHRLSSALEPMISRSLPRDRPYNSFVALADGTLATKDFDHSLAEPACLTLLDPETLESRCADVALPEAVIARLSADGNVLYAVGGSTVWRYHWDGTQLRRDPDWSARYHGGARHSYGWDPVIAGGHVWFLDNGAHEYASSMVGAGRAPGPIRLIRVSVADSSDWEAVEVCGAVHGTATDPPVYDETRRIALGYDSGNRVVAAFRFGDRLEPLWQRRLAHAAHMILYPDTGEVVVHDFHGPAFARSAIVRRLGQRWAGPARSAAFRGAAARRSGDEVVVLDIETGTERARAHVPSMFQSVLFPAPGFGRDLYCCTFSTLARLEVV
jgi:hypothetical protein